MDFLNGSEDSATRNKGFRGWYFKHQCGGDTLAFIPGRAESGAFVQLITAEGSRQFAVPTLSAAGRLIRAGNCRFSPSGCEIELPGVHGAIRYGTLTPLRSDIMGPFRFLPMECRHGVLSMAHTLAGNIIVDGRPHRFNDGVGYIEMDSGTSFPRCYQWLQCNTFASPCSLMVSTACIPFCGMHFTGCICAIVYGGREYRLATYNGVKVLTADKTHLCLRQGDLLLAIRIAPVCGGHALRAPVRGKMTATIRESMDAEIRARLWEHGRPVFDLHSLHAAYEYVPAIRKA